MGPAKAPKAKQAKAGKAPGKTLRKASTKPGKGTGKGNISRKRGTKAAKSGSSGRRSAAGAKAQDEWLQPQPIVDVSGMDLDHEVEESGLETIDLTEDAGGSGGATKAPLPGPITPEDEDAPIEKPDELPEGDADEEGEGEAQRKPVPQPDPEPDHDHDEDENGVGMVTMDEPPAAVTISQTHRGSRSETADAIEEASGAGTATLAQMPLSQELPTKGDVASGLSLVEQFLLVAMKPGWDDRMTKARPGAQGAAIVGSLLLELALRGSLKVQRNRFTIEDALALPPGLDTLAADVRALGGVSTQVAMEKLTKRLPERLRPWVQSLERKGVMREEMTRHLVFLKRSNLILVNTAAKEKLENRLVRTLAGGGNPDARTIMLLGLVTASGLLRGLVPASAYDFNRKRIQALLGGRDTLAYRVDNSIRRVQDLALQTILNDIRILQGTN